MNMTNKKLIAMYASPKPEKDRASGNNISFEKKMFFSYGVLTAIKLKGRFAWVDDIRRSSTTSRHQWQVHAELEASGYRVLRSIVMPRSSSITHLKKLWEEQAQRKLEEQRKAKARRDKAEKTKRRFDALKKEGEAEEKRLADAIGHTIDSVNAKTAGLPPPEAVTTPELPVASPRGLCDLVNIEHDAPHTKTDTCHNWLQLEDEMPKTFSSRVDPEE